MKNIAKPVLMAAGLLLAALFVYQVNPSSDGELPSASISGGPDETETDPVSTRIGQQPTILRAKPVFEGGGSSPRYEPGQALSPEFGIPFERQSPHESSPSKTPPFLTPVDAVPSGAFSTAPALEPAFPGSSYPSTAVEPSGSAPVSGKPFGSAPLELVAPEQSRALPALQTTYTTSDGDSFWNISKLRYGMGDFYRALYAHNRARIRHPDALEAGMEIATPPVEELRRRYPSLCPKSGGG